MYNSAIESKYYMYFNQNAIVQKTLNGDPQIPPEQCALLKIGHGHGWSSLKTGHGQGLLARRGLPPPGHPRNIEPGMNSPFRCGAEPIPGPILPAAAITYKHTQLYLSKAGVWPGVRGLPLLKCKYKNKYKYKDNHILGPIMLAKVITYIHERPNISIHCMQLSCLFDVLFLIFILH